jgi:BTB/POZ domain
MFTHFRESHQSEIYNPEETMDYTTLRIMFEFIYTGSARGITRVNAVDVLVASEMYGLTGTRNSKENEKKKSEKKKSEKKTEKKSKKSEKKSEKRSRKVRKSD